MFLFCTNRAVPLQKINILGACSEATIPIGSFANAKKGEIAQTWQMIFVGNLRFFKASIEIWEENPNKSEARTGWKLSVNEWSYRTVAAVPFAISGSDS
jgi:hypothetical protein